jgi:CheY-like chemotaxis protein
MLKNILLVDDDKVFNFINEKLLNRLNLPLKIATAGNGEEALRYLTNSAKIQSELPDVIFLDLNMPLLDGFGFLKAFENLDLVNKHKILIIIVTSSLNEKDMAQAKSFGIKYYISKPLTEAVIIEIIKKEFQSL